MAKALNVEINYSDDRGPSSDGVPSSGYLSTIDIKDENDFMAANQLNKEFPEIIFPVIMIQVRVLGSGDNFRTVGAVGLDLQDNEIIPFGDRQAAKNIADMINVRSKQIQNQK